MIYIIVILTIAAIIMFIIAILLDNRNTKVIDGEIIRVEKKLRSIIPYKKAIMHYRTTIVYSYIVNNKRYINTEIDSFELSNKLYGYIKNKTNKKILQDEYIYYVENNKIRVRYKINNPEKSKINHLFLKECIFIFTLAFGTGLSIFFLGIIFLHFIMKVI